MACAGHAPPEIRWPPRCSAAIVQAHAPEHVVPGGLSNEAAITHVIVSKFGDHTPFYRQTGI
jgi:transposase